MSYLWCPDITWTVEGQDGGFEARVAEWHRRIANLEPGRLRPTMTGGNLVPSCVFTNTETGQVYPGQRGPQDWALPPALNRTRYLPQLTCTTHHRRPEMFFRHQAWFRRHNARQNELWMQERRQPPAPPTLITPGWIPPILWYTLRRPPRITSHDILQLQT